MTTDFTTMPLVHTLSGTDDVIVERDHHYNAEDASFAFDLYRPPHPRGAPTPAVIFVSGFSGAAMSGMTRKPMKDWASYIGWARLVAASGLVGITYANRAPEDVFALLQHLRTNAAALGIDASRIAVWACSGNAPMALGLLAREPLAAAALLYGYLLDVDGATDVADAARSYHFAAPPVALEDLPQSVPMLVVRAGRDVTPGLDVALQRFVAAARSRKLPLTFVDHTEAPHAFDLLDASPRTHEVIDEVLAFLCRALA